MYSFARKLKVSSEVELREKSIGQDSAKSMLESCEANSLYVLFISSVFAFSEFHSR